MLFATDSSPQSTKTTGSRERRRRVQQDLFLEIKGDLVAPAAPWERLNDEERATVVAVLARLMAKAVTIEEDDDE